MKTGVYAGSFDPLTNGHLWMIEEGAQLFDKLVVAIGINPDKRYTFSLEERLHMLERSTKRFPNVSVASFENQFLVNYAASIGAGFIVRGIRNEDDYEKERTMRHVNNDLNPHIRTAFHMPPRELTEISSSFVKGLVGPEGWEAIIEGYVPRTVYNALLVRNNGLKKRWDGLWQRAGANSNGTEAYQELVALYGETHRAYHSFVHVAHALREFDTARHLMAHPDHVELGLWYHDAVYHTRAGGNEEKSAELAEHRLRAAGINPHTIASVVSLILATKHAAAPQKPDEQFIVDIDLSILGKPQCEFDEYEADIREEYLPVLLPAFNTGRAAILQGFVDRVHIYSTGFFRGKYEAQAQANLRRSIVALNAAADGIVP